jgi:hypothetical protein
MLHRRIGSVRGRRAEFKAGRPITVRAGEQQRSANASDRG